MVTESAHSDTPQIILNGYMDAVLYENDMLLFHEAVKAASNGALRAAYIMLWLACAESLKWRFREARIRDGEAGKIVGEIEKMESEYKAVDKYVLQKANDYGFLSDSGCHSLTHIYERRCIYAHPYTEAPSKDEVQHACSEAVRNILAQPIKLRHGYGARLLTELLENKSFLDNDQEAVELFAQDVVRRLDHTILPWFFNKYWAKLEDIAYDISSKQLFWRGVWFSRVLLNNRDQEIFSEDEWHDKVSTYPRILARIATDHSIFQDVGWKAKDSIVGKLIEESQSNPSVLCYLQRLSGNNAFSIRQKERFNEQVEAISLTRLQNAGLGTRTCYERIIKALTTYNWHLQNPAVGLIMANAEEGVADLDPGQQVELGRNVLQAAEGHANSAETFLNKVRSQSNSWPREFIAGIAMECFANERGEIRFKDRWLDAVCEALSILSESDRNIITDRIIQALDDGKVNEFLVVKENVSSCVETIRNYDELCRLAEGLESRKLTLFS
mgnify:CR=1 FL=1